MRNGDIIIADTAEDETVGKAVELYNGDNIKSVSGLHTIPCRPKTCFASMFLGYYINSYNYRKQLIALMQGIKVLSISKSNIAKTIIAYPSNKEQQKIATFLSLIDDRISKQRELVEKLKTYKRGLLFSILSKQIVFKDINGNNFPKWNQYRLEEIVEFLDEKRKPITSNLRIKGPYPYYGATGIIDYVNDYLFDEELVLLSEDGANIIDRNYPVSILIKGKCWVNNHAHCLRAKHGFSSYYISEYLESIDYTSYNTGSAQPKINQEVCRKIPIVCPCTEEQQRIADLLTKIDKYINMQAKQLDVLSSLKLALLQQMFI